MCDINNNNSVNNNNIFIEKIIGYLELIIGPMFSGKTSRLVEIYNQCIHANISVQVINHTIDDRYDDTLLSTHDKIKIPCIKTNNLSETWEQIKNNKNEIFNVILINEGQFFDDLYGVVEDMLKEGKKIYVCGLDGDFERKKFGKMLDLVPLCDKVVKLTSLCSICKDGTRGIFSMRITNETEQTVVGFDNYISVCRKCYEQNNINK
jgi:thymidine kinase